MKIKKFKFKKYNKKYFFFYFFLRPVSLVLEPILKEPGDIAFTWLEIYRTRNSLIQQLDLQANASVMSGGAPSGNDTLTDIGFYPKESDCEYKCPELDACIAGNLWCDGA